MLSIWLLLILGLIVIVGIILYIFLSRKKKGGNGSESSTQQTSLQQIKSPWYVNTTEWPLDPFPVPQGCPTCQIYTFQPSTPFQPAIPRLQDLKSCLDAGTCVAEPCGLTYPTCYLPDQLGAFLGSHNCISGPSGFAGTGCLSQTGQTVPIGSSETYYDSCGNKKYPPCIDNNSNLTYGMFVLNWGLGGYNVTPNQNPMSNFICLQADNLNTTFTPSVSVQTCNIGVNDSEKSQLWIFKSYTFTNVVNSTTTGIIPDKNGSFYSIQNHRTGAYLIPTTYNPITKIFTHPEVATGNAEVNLQLWYAPSAQDEPICWYWVQGVQADNTIFNTENYFPTSKIDSAFLFVPDYSKFPSPEYGMAFKSTIFATSGPQVSTPETIQNNFAFYISPVYNHLYSNYIKRYQEDQYTSYDIFTNNLINPTTHINDKTYHINFTATPFNLLSSPHPIAIVPEGYLDTPALITPYLSFFGVGIDWIPQLPYFYHKIVGYTDYTDLFQDALFYLQVSNQT